MTNLTPLRNIYLSGGLFTENLLLKIRDKRDDIKEVQWNTFGENWKEEKKRFKEIWDWAKRLFGDISDSLDNWSIEQRFDKWIKPLLLKLEHETEPKPQLDLNELSEEEQDNVLNRIQISHRLKNHAKIGLHICENDDFDEKNDSNYQKKSQHDHFQRYILLNEGVRWGLLSNGKYIRLLGEYSNIYAKGYVQFNLDSIFINKDESEFWVFYALMHHSRFNETYGLNPDDWIDKLKKKWKDLSRKISSEDADINSNIISEEVLKIYNKILNEFIAKANNKGVMAVKMSDSEIFMQNLKEKGFHLGEIGRDFYLKELDSVISYINENLSIIQRLQKRSQEEGIEAGKKLRENVKKALELMGEGLINSSKDFTNDILKGNVEIKEFYQELLRITYRIIFILYAEAKNLLPGVATIYYNDLGLTFLRKKAQQPIRDDQNTDLWHRLLLLFKYLDIGEASLGINAFSGELFNPRRISLILDENYNISLINSTILSIIRELTIVDFGIGLQPIDYSEIGEEEIGSIYEALLDFQPRYVKKDSPTCHFILEEIDTERKGSGTYYTPKGLIDILLKTALKPVIENKLKGLKTREEKLKALLDLKICDPACGGGSFLLASIDYLGKIHAQIESDQEFPEEKFLRKSRRSILQHCIYGVDLNPMALELAKISLWLKAAVKDKPLTFLDNHLKKGNSLIGFAKKPKIGKIPLNAYNAVKGNSKTGILDENSKFVQDAKKKLKAFSISNTSLEGKTSVQKTLFPYKDSEKYSSIAHQVFEMDENDLRQLHEKKRCYSELLRSNSWNNLNLQCNLWTSAFFWNMGKNHIKETPTDTLILMAKQVVLNNDNPTVKEVDRLKESFMFFNWFLEFPEIFQKNLKGFDCILMNPPWEVMLLKETEFFAGKSDDIINTPKQSERHKEIKKLLKINRALHQEYTSAFFEMKKKNYYIKESQFYKLSSSGAINIFANFIERARQLIKKSGKIGCIVQSTVLFGKNLSVLFQDLGDTNSLETSLHFINQDKIFPVHSSLEFCLLTITYPNIKNKAVLMVFNQRNVKELQLALDALDNNKKIDTLLELELDDFKLFNPNTKNTPIFSNKVEYNLVSKAYNKLPILILKSDNEEIKNPWNIVIKRFFHPSDDSKLFKTEAELLSRNAKLFLDNNDYINKWILDNEIYYPIYTGSAIWLYDHRFNNVFPKLDKSKKLKSDIVKVEEKKKKDPYYTHIPMYWIEESLAIQKFPKIWNKNWYLGFRDVSGSANQRSFILSVIPKVSSIGTLQMVYFKSFTQKILCLIANFSSIPFDFIARNKVFGIHFSQYIVEQLPIFPPEIYNKELFYEIRNRVIKLIYTSWCLENFAIDFGINKNQKPFIWDRNEREIIEAELNAIFLLMYGYSRRDSDYILNTFTSLKNYELREFGEFKTKRLVLEAYDKFNSNPELGPLFRLEGVELKKLRGE